MNEQIERLRKASMAVYLATEKDVADDLSNMLIAAADRIAELERIGNIRQEIMEIQEEQIAELNFETELSKEQFADIEDDCRKLRTENARLREAHKSNSHQELKTVEYAERGHRCSYRAAYEAVKQRSQMALLVGGEK